MVGTGNREGAVDGGDSQYRRGQLLVGTGSTEGGN